VCEAVGEPRALGVPARAGVFPMGFGSVDGHVLAIWVRALTSSETSDIAYSAQWFDRDFAPDSEVFTLGTGIPTHRVRLLAHDHALWAQLYVDPNGAIPALEAIDVSGIWEFRPGEPPESSQVSLPVSHDRYRPDWHLPFPSISTSNLSAGGQGEIPITQATGQVVAGVNAIPGSCGGFVDNRLRNLLFTAERSEFFLAGDDPCQILPNSLMTTNIQLIPVAGEVGVLFRLGESGTLGFGQPSVGGHVHFMRVNANLELTIPPVMVGNPSWVYPTVDSGYQPKAAVVAGDRVIWNERHDLFDYSGNMCQRMHIMNGDGRHVRDTPWQLPCDGNRDRYFTSSSDLRSLPSGDAVIAWGERNAFDMLHAWNTHVTADTPWEEGIYLALLTPEGRRGSPIVEVTPPESTMLGPIPPRTADDGPFPGDYLVQMAQDGDETVIAWFDRRADAPGMWAARYRCHRVGE